MEQSWAEHSAARYRHLFGQMEGEKYSDPAGRSRLGPAYWHLCPLGRLAGQYVGPDVYQFWNFDTHTSFSYSKNTRDDKNLN